MSKQDVWIAFLLKDKYSSENEKDKLKRQVIKKFKRNNNDVCYISCNQKNGLSYYFFVKEYLQDDLKNIYEFYSSYFSLYSYQAKITENELNEMLKTIDKKEENEIAKFGDFGRFAVSSFLTFFIRLIGTIPTQPFVSFEFSANSGRVAVQYFGNFNIRFALVFLAHIWCIVRHHDS